MRLFALFLPRPGLIKVQVVASKDDSRAHGAAFVGTTDEFEAFCGTRGHPVSERGRAALAECLAEISGMPAYFNAERAYDPGPVVARAVPESPHGAWPQRGEDLGEERFDRSRLRRAGEGDWLQSNL